MTCSDVNWDAPTTLIASFWTLWYATAQHVYYYPIDHQPYRPFQMEYADTTMVDVDYDSGVGDVGAGGGDYDEQTPTPTKTTKLMMAVTVMDGSGHQNKLTNSTGVDGGNRTTVSESMSTPIVSFL